MELSVVHTMSEAMLSFTWSLVFLETITESMLESIAELNRCVHDCSVQCCVVEWSMLNKNMESSFVHVMSESILSSMWSRVVVNTIAESMLETSVELSRCVRDCHIQCCVMEWSLYTS